MLVANMENQILFVRMSVTTFGITFWLWRQKKPNTILGRKENRPLLLLRAFGGFLGVFGLYCMYGFLYLAMSSLALNSPRRFLEIPQSQRSHCHHLHDASSC